METIERTVRQISSALPNNGGATAGEEARAGQPSAEADEGRGGRGGRKRKKQGNTNEQQAEGRDDEEGRMHGERRSGVERRTEASVVKTVEDGERLASVLRAWRYSAVLRISVAS